MTLPSDKKSVHRAFTPLRNTLKEIYGAMDDAYDAVARQYGFYCKGCDDNCCRSRFYHHTYVEYYYLSEGFYQLAPAFRDTVRRVANNRQHRKSRSANEKCQHRPMCPLNFDGLCVLYPYRPMICRLHGIPHELQPPGQGKILNVGCRDFEKRNSTRMHVPFDRTPFYTKMAGLEKEFRQQAGTTQKIKMTVSQMIVSFAEKHE